MPASYTVDADLARMATATAIADVLELHLVHEVCNALPSSPHGDDVMRVVRWALSLEGVAAKIAAKLAVAVVEEVH